MERLLATETGDQAARLSRELAAEWERLEEPDGVRRALELGYRGCPEDDDLRQRLETWYQDHEEWEPLARLLASEANRLADPVRSVALLRNAAQLHREVLGNPQQAADMLGQAREHAPADMALLGDVARSRAASGDAQTGIEEVSSSLEEQASDPSLRASLLRLRAELRLPIGLDSEAVEDLEEAYSLAPAESAAELVAGLRTRREQAATRGETEEERAVTLRLVQVLSDAGQADEARDILEEWVGRMPEDREALLLLREVDESAERWADVARTCERLIEIDEGDEQIDAALRLVEACGRAGDPAAAKAGLESVQAAQPESAVVRQRLRELYEQMGAHAELASLLLQDAQYVEDPEEKYELLRRSGDLFLEAGDAAAAVGPLEEAARVKPDAHPTVISLVDCYIASERFADAGQMLEQAIAAHTRRRSPELAELQHRMARLAQAAGDPQLQLQWLNAAMDSDKSNGHVAAELAQLAMDLGDHDAALNALRVVTLNKTEGPMGRGMAFLLQAKIAHQRGEARRALLWARKARSEDPELEEAAEVLRALGEG